MMSLKALQRRIFAVAIIGMVALFFTSLAFPATTIVVDQNGGGSYRTIGEGINAAVGGDTVKVLAGMYEEQVSINKSITLIGEGPDTTTIRNPGGTAIVVGVDVGTRISGFEIMGSRNGISVGSRANVVIENNLIVGNGNIGINADGDSSTSVSVINNTIVENGSNGIFFDGYQGTFLSSSNNIITNNVGYGILSGRRDCNTLTAVYNNIYGNTTGNSDCTLNSTNISQDPRFVSAATGNYQLRADSPCVNAGTPSASASDPDGTRNNMGAWGGPGAVGFWPSANGAPIITDLSVTPGSVSRGGRITIRATGQIK